ncbi:hypothetical protein L1286_23710 [Pseudoalteromonas sp. SMS1]|uniref:hypothetical protein n=1 Tax=Pseudoalteromonas sp. SMS1 TaxID=2908894 RepID=UPI001F247230|nr:hypothetical protein [Pseudoalteromonas sp. SMS1]MCF2860474.1 hypothetical protein [Pseudoalteromonas sp. SMS1]
MNILSFIRSYYLYFYYQTSINQKTGKLVPSMGFVTVVLLVMIFHAGTLLYTFNAVGYRFMNEVLTDTLFSFRGDVNLIIILAAVFAILFTYLVCCFGIKFEEIGARLAKTRWLAKRSVWKMILLPVLSMAMFILSGVLFY